MIKTFRGLMADATQQRLNLHTNDGKTGYRVKKFSLINSNAGDVDYSAVVKIYSAQQTAYDNNIDFSDTTLLGVGYISNDASSTQYPEDLTIIFDDVIINQDIFISCNQTTASDSDSCNYYIELEQIKLNPNEATVATLQSLRNG